jgi:hypothetical protein
MNNDFWDKNDHELDSNSVYERTAENEYNNPEKQAPVRTEREFETHFTFAYDNCRGNPHKIKKSIFATTETTDQGRDQVRIELLKKYPNLDIHSIIHKEI